MPNDVSIPVGEDLRVLRRGLAFSLAVAAILAGLVTGAACSGDQDPGLEPQERPAQTSDTLGRCPDGGPDATTPPAGCLDPDGRVVHP